MPWLSYLTQLLVQKHACRSQHMHACWLSHSRNRWGVLKQGTTFVAWHLCSSFAWFHKKRATKTKGQSSDYNRLSVKVMDDLLICPHLISPTCNNIDQIAAITRLPFHISVKEVMANLVMVQCTFPPQIIPSKERTTYSHHQNTNLFTQPSFLNSR